MGLGEACAAPLPPDHGPHTDMRFHSLLRTPIAEGGLPSLRCQHQQASCSPEQWPQAPACCLSHFTRRVPLPAHQGL